MAVPKDIQQRMDKTKARRERRQRNQVTNAGQGKKSGCFLFGLIALCFAGLVACGPVGQPAPHPATTVAVPAPGGGA